MGVPRPKCWDLRTADAIPLLFQLIDPYGIHRHLRANAIYHVINKAKMTNHYGSHKNLPADAVLFISGAMTITVLHKYLPADALYLPFRQITGHRPNWPHGF